MKDDMKRLRHKYWARIKMFLFLCLCVPLLPGCWDSQELEHMFYIHALGIDYQDGKYIIYAQILDPTALSKESQKSEEGLGAWVGVGVGQSYEDAIHDLYATSQRRIRWGHLNAIVFSEPLLAQKGVQESLDMVTRYEEIRYIPWVYCTDSSIPKVLSSAPILESSPVFSFLSDPYAVYRQSSFIEPVRLHRFITNLQEPGRPGIPPEISVKENRWFDAKATYPEIEISGYGLLRNGKLVGRLSRDEAIGERWFSPHISRIPLILNQRGDSIATMTIIKRKCRVRPVIIGGHLRFDAQIQVGGSIVQRGRPLSQAQLESMISKKIEKEIRKTYENGLRYGVDIYTLADSLYRRDPQTFHRYATKDGHLQLSEDSLEHVEVKVKIYDMGKATESANRFTS
ncbi:Ger(x)C family spore germination protein [Alicyclobacillus fastidiosus]|nr:Ger(x)C family spore germination protein [Alicyclobacillus fastidiosus]